MAGTVYSVFKDAEKTHDAMVALATIRSGRYEVVSYGELREQVEAFASHLASRVEQGDAVAIMLDNGPEWAVVDLACAAIGAVSVPIHTTYTARYVNYILQHADISVLAIQAEHFGRLAADLKEFKGLMVVVGSPDRMPPHSVRFDDWLRKSNVAFHARGISSDDVHTVVYTSGTTGDPKGVMLTHANLVSNALAATRRIKITPDDRFFSFLPLSHIFERTAGYYVPLFSGASIYYARNAKTILDDIAMAKPTVLVSVPRIFERAHEKIREKLSKESFITRVFVWALETSQNKTHSDRSMLDRIGLALSDKVFFKKIRKIFGGKLRFAVSGGASLSVHVAYFFKAMGVKIIEGYGLTETSPILTTNTLEEQRIGTVGVPLDNVEIKVDANGEIVARGAGLMKGYYNAPDLTADVMDDDGWFHTGDLGSTDEDGFLTILGRKKEMIVLSTGRNVFPVPIEQALEEDRYVKQAMVYGDNQRAVSAFIVPDFENLKVWCQENGVRFDAGSLVRDDKINELFRGIINKHLGHFQSFEQVRDFKLVKDEFTVENEMLTPSLKLRRDLIISRHV